MNNLKLILLACPLAALFIYVQAPAIADDYAFSVNEIPLTDTLKKDSVVYETVKGLPLKPKRKISFTSTEGTWTSVDINPDGKSIVL